MGITNLGLFLVASIALILAPGPDSLYVLARGLGQGRRAGLVAALGSSSGLLVHTTLAALGLAVLLQTSEIAYTIVRVGGALYLIHLGVRALLSRQRFAVGATASQFSPQRMYLQGMLTNVLNPKVALFFLAFLPQFVAPDAANKVLAFVLLGAVFNVNATLWNLVVAWSAAGIARRVRAAPRAVVSLHRVVGGLFIALGVKLALTERG